MRQKSNRCKRNTFRKRTARKSKRGHKAPASILLCAAHTCALRCVFNHKTQFAQSIAHRIGKGEVLFLASFGTTRQQSLDGPFGIAPRKPSELNG